MNYHHQHETEDYDSPGVLVPMIMAMLPIASVVDVGCGLGTWLKVFKGQGVKRVLGIESTSTVAEYLTATDIEIVNHDLTQPLSLEDRFDLALCLEVAEHLEEAAADTLVATLTGLSDHILFSAAIPNQGGQNHVNEQWPDYWQKKFQQAGYLMLDPFRAAIWENDKISWCYRQNVLLLVRKPEGKMLQTPVYENKYVHPELLSRKIESIRHIYRGHIGPRRAFRIFLKSLIWRLGFSK